jgi:hypothetical protein
MQENNRKIPIRWKSKKKIAKIRTLNQYCQRLPFKAVFRKRFALNYKELLTKAIGDSQTSKTQIMNPFTGGVSFTFLPSNNTKYPKYSQTSSDSFKGSISQKKRNSKNQ